MTYIQEALFEITPKPVDIYGAYEAASRRHWEALETAQQVGEDRFALIALYHQLIKPL